MERLMRELEYRKNVLLSMVEHNVRDYRSLNTHLSKYYHSLGIQPEKLSEITSQ
jgi:hypothetical protein